MDELKKKMDALLKAIKETGKAYHDLNIKGLGKVEMSAKQCAHLCNQINLKYHEGLEERVVQFRFTDTTVDRDGDVIKSSGVDLSQYKQEPVVLLQHESRKFPVGRTLKVKYRKEENDIVGWILFFDNEIDPTGLSDATFRMVDNGALNTGSIGFEAEPKDVRKPSPEEREQYGMGDYGLVFDKITLLEFSIVTIPANPNARQIATAKSLKFYSDPVIDELRKTGAMSDEVHAQITEKAEGTEETEEVTETENRSMDITIYINKNDTMSMRAEKIKAAKELKEAGENVTIVMFKEEKNVTNNIVGVSEEQKESIKKILAQFDTLKEELEVLLKSAEPKEIKSPTETEDVQTDSSEEEKGEKLYNIIEEAENKIKNN